MTEREALKLALEALIGARAFLESDAPVEIWSLNDKAITAIKEALAQPEQGPMAYQDIAEKCRLETVPAKGTLLHTSPPASKSWQGLTDEDIDKLADMHRKEYGQLCDTLDLRMFARAAIEAAHGIKE